MGKVIPDLQLFLALILASFTILGLDSVSFLNWPKTAGYFLTNPISFGLYQTKQNFSSQLGFIVVARKSAQANKALQEQLGQLLAENANLNRRLAKAEALVAQQEHLDPIIYNLQPARPIGLERYLHIDKGFNDGISLGRAVVFKDHLIGKVVSVTPKSANVQPLTDPDSKVAAFSLNKDGKAKGVLIGQFGNQLLLDKILHEEKIAVGDLVYSEGTEGYLPRGLILGRVSTVIGQENQVFKQAKISPIFDIRDLELVFVMGE